MFNKLKLRLRALCFKSRMEDELDEELRFHLEKEIEQNVARGMSLEEARYAARRSFGGVERVKEESRDERGIRLLEELWQDLRFGWRTLLKNPGFMLIALISLALGIGANTAIFSIVEAVLIRPLPYQDMERLVWLANTNRILGVTEAFLNEADILDYREQATSLEQIASWGTLPSNLTGVRNPERLETINVTPNFFQMLGVKPMLGRDFVVEDAAEGSESIIISYSLWKRQFGCDPRAIGRRIGLGGPDPNVTIIGVMPPEFQFPPRIEVFGAYQGDRATTPRGGSHNSRTIARLKPGITIDQAQAEISAIARRQAQLYPDTNKGWDLVVVPFREYFFGGAEVALPLMLGAAGLVLLIACTNIAGLQLARATTRQKEIAIRLSLGATRYRIVRQLLTESVMLAVGGGIVGLALAKWSLSLLQMLGADSVPRLKEAVIDVPALGFTIVASVLTGLIFGLIPALQSSRTNLNRTLNNARNSSTAVPRQQRFRSVLVVSQIALAVLLLVGAGLLIKSFWVLHQVSPGFQAEQVLTAGLSVDDTNEYQDRSRRAQFFKQGLERLVHVPGVESVGAISHLPFGGRTLQASFNFVADRSAAVKRDAPMADYRVVTPSLFETLRIPLKGGRSFTEHDRTGSPMVYLINEAFARTYFAGRDPIGEQLEITVGIPRVGIGEIIGIVGNVKHRGLESAAIPTIYVSYLQNCTFPIMNYVIRAKVDPATLMDNVRRELQTLDPNQVVFNVRPMTEFVSDSIAQRRFHAILLGSFAVMALLLAVIGIYGVMSYLVAQRVREIGIRMALGATPREIFRVMVGHGMILTTVGVTIGLAIALASTRLMSSLLFGVSPADLWTFGLAALIIVNIALLASYLPARRATKINPIVALRLE